jgi:hypothetical protein
MSDLRTAAQQALEALWLWMDADSSHTEQHAAYHALKAALAQHHDDVAIANPRGGGVIYKTSAAATDAAIRAKLVELGWTPPAALEQQEQEPVAWMDEFGNAFPLGAVKGAGSWRDDHQRNWTPLYTHPPRREWIGLTEEEIRELTFHNQRTLWPRPDRSDVRATAIPFARAIEQALKEKNHG